MIFLGTILKSLIAATLTVQLGAGATSPTIEIRKVYSPTFSYTVSDNLPWSKSLLEGARIMIDARVKALESSFQLLRDRGATSLKVKAIDDLRTPNELRALAGATRFRLIGMAGGYQVRRGSIELPNSMDYGDFLIRPSSSSCSLEQFELFWPATWFLDRCQIEKPTPARYLNFHTRALLNLTNPRDLVEYLEGALQEMAAMHRPFTVEDGKIKADFFGENADLNEIPLQNPLPLGGYKILVNSSKTKFTFIETPPDLKKLASRGYYNPKDKTLDQLVP